VKEAIITAQETDAALILRRWANTFRMLSNKFLQEALAVEKASKTRDFSEIAPYVSVERGREVFLNGDVEHGASYYMIHICSAPEVTFFPNPL
jgi:hypothetical protein